MANPIKLTDIFEYDASIKMIEESLDNIAKKMDHIVGIAQNMKKTKFAPDDMDSAVEKAKALEKVHKKLAETRDEEIVKLRAYQLGLQKIKKIQDLELKASLELDNTYSSMISNIKLLNEKLNNLTDDQKKNTTEGKAMVKQYKALIIEQAKQKKAKSDEIRLAKLAAKEADAEKGSYNQLSAEYSRLKIELNKMSASRRENTKEGKAMVARSKEVYDEMKRLQEITGKHTLNVGNYSDAISGLSGSLGQIPGINTRIVDSGQEVLVVFRKISKHPIVAALVALAAVAAALGSSYLKSSAGASKMDKIQGALKGSTVALSSAFKDLTTGNLKGFWGRLTDIFHAYEGMNRSTRVYNRQNAESTKTIGDLEVQMAKYNDRVGDGTLSFNELKEANEKVLSIEQKIAMERYKIADNNFKLISADINARRNAGREVSHLLQQEADAYAERSDAQAQLTAAKEKAAKESRTIRQDELEQELDYLIDGFDTIRKIEEKSINELGYFDDKIDSFKKLKDSAEESFNAQIAIIEEFSGKKIDADSFIEESNIKVINSRVKDLKMSDTAKKRFLEIIRERKLAVSELWELEVKIYKDEKKRKKQENQEIQKYSLERIDLEYDVEIQLIELSNKSEQEKTRLKLEAEKDRLEKILQQRIDFEKAGGEIMSTLELQNIKNSIELVDKKINSIKSKDSSIYAKLGFILSDDEKAGFEDSISFVKEQITELAALQTKLAEQKLEEGNRALEEAQLGLQAEIALKEAGLAYDVEGAKKQVEIAKNQQRELLEDRRKAQQTELALQSIEQGVNLVTAASKIYAQIGEPITASILVGAMFAAFAASKVKAYQLTKKTFRKGGFENIDKGGSHESGNDVNVGYTLSSDLRAERGEALTVWNHKALKYYGASAIERLTNDINGLRVSNYLEDSGAKEAIVVNMDTSDLSRTMNKNLTKQTYTTGMHRVVRVGNKTVRYAI
jgi:hypothetical protein